MAALKEVLTSCGSWFLAEVSACLYGVIVFCVVSLWSVPFVCCCMVLFLVVFVWM